MKRRGRAAAAYPPRQGGSPASEALGDGERPDDLFGNPAMPETLPLPSSGGSPADCSDLPDDEGYKVGPGKPPLSSRWVKGGASPNPRGRPPKKKSGRVRSILEREIEVSTGNGSRMVTRREALDLSLRQKAIEEGGGWKKLWEEQQEFDRKLAERVRLSVDQEAKSRGNDTAARVRREIQQSDFTVAFFERAFPGMLDTIRVLGPNWEAFAEEQREAADRTGITRREAHLRGAAPAATRRVRPPPSPK